MLASLGTLVSVDFVTLSQTSDQNGDSDLSRFLAYLKPGNIAPHFRELIRSIGDAKCTKINGTTSQ
jgi:hypothetical protein